MGRSLFVSVKTSVFEQDADVATFRRDTEPFTRVVPGRSLTELGRERNRRGRTPLAATIETLRALNAKNPAAEHREAASTTGS
jgi:hypothetical protein